MRRACESRSLEKATWSTISECLPPEDFEVLSGESRSDGVPHGNPVFHHAQHLLDSSKSLLEIYGKLDDRIVMLRRTGPKRDVLLEDVAHLEKLLETQGQKTKSEISDHLHANGNCRKRGTQSKNEDAEAPYVREARTTERENTRKASDNWASEAKWLERNVGKLTRYLSDDGGDRT